MNSRVYLSSLRASGFCWLLMMVSSSYSAIVTSHLNAGGNHASSLSYGMDGSIGGFCGVSSAQPTPYPGITAKHGYIGQLYELQTLNVAASSVRIDENSQGRLNPFVMNDDGSVLSLNANNVSWSRAGGLINSITSDGVVSTANVYEESPAIVAARYLTLTNTISLIILNTGNDDFQLYAQDGIDDAWQVRYFGLNQTNAYADYDFDHDGVSNLHEYIADTNPTNATSFFRVQSILHASENQIRFHSSTQRRYTLYYTTNLTLGVWKNMEGQTDIPGTGGIDALFDSTNPGIHRWYRIGARML